jgi:hypothetical protein
MLRLGPTSSVTAPGAAAKGRRTRRLGGRGREREHGTDDATKADMGLTGRPAQSATPVVQGDEPGPGTEQDGDDEDGDDR